MTGYLTVRILSDAPPFESAYVSSLDVTDDLLLVWLVREGEECVEAFEKATVAHMDVFWGDG